LEVNVEQLLYAGQFDHLRSGPRLFSPSTTQRRP